jgi:predicted RNase H-like HicB family nuclease
MDVRRDDAQFHCSLLESSIRTRVPPARQVETASDATGLAYHRGVADGPETYDVTLERGTDGTYLGWVDELPGCAVRAASRTDVLSRLPDAISEFVEWTGQPRPASPRIRVAEEVESAIEADEDTEVLVAADRGPLTEEDWARVDGWLEQSRSELIALLDRLGEEQIDRRRAGSERTVREELEHVALVELMYAAWTFDRRSREGLTELLGWTRAVATDRLRVLGERRAADLTWANWSGAPRPEPWTPRKAARRLVWHELLHLRAIDRVAGPR